MIHIKNKQTQISISCHYCCVLKKTLTLCWIIPLIATLICCFIIVLVHNVQQHGVAGCTCKSEGFHRLCFQFQIKLHLVLLPTFQTYSKDTWSVLLWLCAEAFKTLRELRKPLLPAQCGDASLKHLSRPWLQPKWLRHCRGTVGTQVRSLSDVISWSSPISLPHFHSPSHNVLSS